MTGTIRTLRVDKGFGFIKDDSGKGYFFPQSAVSGEGLDNLREGDSVEFAAADGRCGGWVADRWQDIEQIDPDLLVLGGPDGAGFRAGPEVWEARARHTLEDVVPNGMPVAVLSAFPPASLNVPSCLSEHLYDVSPCEPKWPSTRARTVEINERLRSVAGELGASVVELVPLLCLPDRCPVIVENVLVFRDAYHVTSAFAASRAGDLGDRLRRAID